MSTTPGNPREESARYLALLAEAQQIRGVSLRQDAWRRLRRNWAAMTSLSFLCVLGLLSLMVPLLPLQSPKEQNVSERQFEHPNLQAHALGLYEFWTPLNQGTKQERELAEAAYQSRVGAIWDAPSAFDRALIRVRMRLFGDRCIPSICGTDELGQDLLSRIFWGSRVSLNVGIVATLVSLVIGVSYGAVAGYAGGRLDNVMMRIVDVLYSIPFIYVVIFLITILNEAHTKAWLKEHHIDKIMIFYICIGAIYWLTMARVVRGQMLSLKHEQFVEAARAVGARPGRIVFRHLVPNLLSVVIVYLTLTIPSVMLFEAFLSFLGLGVDPPGVSWGILANDGVRAINPLQIQWWLVVFPGLALALTLFALNFLGDGLRDALDPRLKNK